MNRSERLAWPYLFGLALLGRPPRVRRLRARLHRVLGAAGSGVQRARELHQDAGRRLPSGKRIFELARLHRHVRPASARWRSSVSALLLHSHFPGSSTARAVRLSSDAWCRTLPTPSYGCGSSTPCTGRWPASSPHSDSPRRRGSRTRRSARLAVAIMAVFQIGEGLVIALAARRALPDHLFEAATVDGAGAWFTFRRVTLPLMAPVLLLLTLRDVILALQLNFVPALLVTDGGPRPGNDVPPDLRLSTGVPLLPTGLCVGRLIDDVRRHRGGHLRALPDEQTLAPPVSAGT